MVTPKQISEQAPKPGEEPCSGAWDWNGDYFRCPCGAVNQTGVCKQNAEGRNDAPEGQSVRTEASARSARESVPSAPPPSLTPEMVEELAVEIVARFGVGGFGPRNETELNIARQAILAMSLRAGEAEAENARLKSSLYVLGDSNFDAQEKVAALEQQLEAKGATEQEPCAWRWKEDSGPWRYAEHAPLHSGATN